MTLLLRMVAAHLIADFLLQKSTWVEERSRRGWASIWLYTHSFVAALLTYVFAGLWHAFWIPVVVFVTHLLLDRWKSGRGDTTLNLLVDQLGHMLVLVVLWAFAVRLEWSVLVETVERLAESPAVWVLFLAYAIVVWPVGILLGKFTQPWRAESEAAGPSGLMRAGLWIGRLERLLVLTAILVGRLELVGFLIAGKSILRFGELRGGSRAQAEYVLIGTMMSFAVAIAVGLVANWLLRVLPLMAL